MTIADRPAQFTAAFSSAAIPPEVMAGARVGRCRPIRPGGGGAAESAPRHVRAVAATSRVLGLDAAATASALDTALSQAAGRLQLLADAAWTKRFQVG